MIGEQYRNEALTLFVIVGIVVGTLEGFHLGGIDPIGFVGVLLSIAFISVGVLHALPVAESAFVLEATVVSVLAPIAIEPSLRFELIGVGIALAFVVGVLFNRAVMKTEPRPRT